MLCIVRLPSLKEGILAFILVPFLGRWRGVLRDSVTLHSPHLSNIIDLDLIWEALFLFSFSRIIDCPLHYRNVNVLLAKDVISHNWLNKSLVYWGIKYLLKCGGEYHANFSRKPFDTLSHIFHIHTLQKYIDKYIDICHKTIFLLKSKWMKDWSFMYKLN